LTFYVNKLHTPHSGKLRNLNGCCFFFFFFLWSKTMKIDPHKTLCTYKTQKFFPNKILYFYSSKDSSLVGLLFSLGQVNLISRLSCRVTKKCGAGGRILFYNFYFPKEKLLMTILFLSTKGVSFNAPNIINVFLTFLLNRKWNLKFKYRGRTPKFSRKCHFYKIEKIGAGQFLRGGRGW
jgi:hypothetical protein